MGRPRPRRPAIAVGGALLTGLASGFLPGPLSPKWAGTVVNRRGSSSSSSSTSSSSSRSSRRSGGGTALSMVGQLLNRGEKDADGKLKTDKSGFPVGDPRAKGGTEKDVGLQVGPMMWRWPSQWPYPADFFDVADNTTSSLDFFASNKAYGPFITGEKLAALHEHLNRHLPEDASAVKVLDLGAGAQTLLPESYVPGGGIAGVGASEAEMAANARLGERVVLDLNDLAEGKQSLPYADKSFDVVLCTAAMEYMTDPQSTFAEVYRVLKEGGQAVLVFTSAGSYTGSEGKQVKYWTDEDYDFNDAKKLYMAGSFFQFSAGGWSFLKGYKIWESDDGAKDEGGLLDKLPGFGNKDKDGDANKENGLYVVSSVRASPPGQEAGALRVMQASLWDSKNLLPDERRLCCERLFATMNSPECEGNEAKMATVARSTPFLEEIYEVLEPMKLKVLPLPICAMLAANLAPSFAEEGADGEALKGALKEGLGLSPPQEDFWKPVGALTKSLIAEEKIWLLVDFVPFFATPEKKARLLLLPPILEKAVAAVQGVVADLEEADAQLLAVDLTITDFLLKEDDPDGVAFIAWLEALAPFQLRDILDERKKFDVSGGRGSQG